MAQTPKTPTTKLPDDIETVTAEPESDGAIATERTSTALDDNDTLSIRTETMSDKLKTSSEKIAGQAADKARGLVSQGLERTAEALGNVSRMVGDTAGGIDERLGAEYGDYARRAANALEKASTNLASKDADELIDDTREFVKKSPGVALAGAAVVGFVLARLVKSGLDSDRDRRGDRNA